MAKKRKRKSRSKGLWSKRQDYTRQDGVVISMDSSWEVACALKLDDLGVDWVRDPDMKLEYRNKRLKLKRYIPDFYLPSYDMYIEVKGYWTDNARWKMRDICSRYPGKIKMLESLDEIAQLTTLILPCTGSL